MGGWGFIGFKGVFYELSIYYTIGVLSSSLISKIKKILIYFLFVYKINEIHTKHLISFYYHFSI